MSHYEITRWVDFVRGIGDEDSRRTMGQHLASGCRSCGRDAELARSLQVLAAADASSEVPGHAEQAVKAMFVLRQPDRLRLLSRIAARLVFSEAGAASAAGVRSLERLSHQALYEAGDFSLDVRLDQEGAARMVLVGQITDRVEPTHQLSNLPVVLMCGREVVAQASSNQFGEFQLECEPRPRLTLCAAVGNGKRIEVPLPGLAGGRSVRGSGSSLRKQSRKRER